MMMFNAEVIEPIAAYVAPGCCQIGEEWVRITLAERRQVTPHAHIFTWGCPDDTKPLNLPTCACVLVRGIGETAPKDPESGEMVVRPYTPISTNAMIGKFETMVKTYSPPGAMSSYIASMRPGDGLEFKHLGQRALVAGRPSNVKKQYVCARVCHGGIGDAPLPMPARAPRLPGIPTWPSCATS